MAQTYKNLYPAIYAFDNLYQAHRQARRGGKTSTGLKTRAKSPSG